MKMKPSYRVIDWPGSAYWLVFAALWSAGGIAAIAYGRGWERALGALVLIVFGCAVALRYAARWGARLAIDYTLAPWGIDVRRMSMLEPIHADLRELVADELEHWREYAILHKRGSLAVVTCMNEGSINFVSRRFRAPYINAYLAGVARGNDITVTWEPGETWEVVRQRVRHELAHVALNAMGIPRGEGDLVHHKVQEAEGRL